MTDLEKAELLQEQLESVANMLRGMCMDRTIPQHTRQACENRVAEIDRFILENGVS